MINILHIGTRIPDKYWQARK